MSAIKLIACIATCVALSGCATGAVLPYNRIQWSFNSDGRGAVPVFILPGELADFKEAAAKLADPENIRFYVFTSNNDPSDREELIIDDPESLERSSWIRGAPVKFLAHGFSSGINTGYPAHIRDAYLAWGEQMNVILVDWSKLAAPPLYNLAAANTKMVGEKSGHLLAWLHSQGAYSINDLHIAGMSLGAHVAGITGSTLTALTGLKAPRITGNDPAGPLFVNADDADRIDPTDGDFVDILHTAGGTLGLVARLGHVDFYPNGGKVQPGCALDLTGTCSHFRGHELNLESIKRESNRFSACLCDDWAQFNNGDCPCTVKADMGEPCSPSAVHGSYFLKTDKKSPFALA